MSRCFPFPPPGYEKKPRSEEEDDLLKEEKRKEKKQKKEKKDKEKREGKEKKDKDKSDGKHREKKEKKDKKEKHKDKKDNKDKEKNSTPDDAVLPGPSNGGKLHEKDEHKDRHISSEKGERFNHGRANQFSAVEAEDSKFVQELGRRIRDDEQGARSQLPERSPVERKRDEKMDRVGIKDSGNLVEVMGKNKERGIYNSKMDGQVFRAELKIGGNTIPPSLSATAKSKFEGTSRLLEENVEKTRVGIKDSGNLVEVKGKNKERGISNSKMDGQVFRAELKIGANATPPSHSATAKSKFEGTSRLLEENVEKTRVGIKDSGILAEVKEKNKEKGIDSNRMDGQVLRGELKIGANAISPSLSAMAKSKFEGPSRLLEENVEKTRVGIKDSGNLAEVKEKNKEKGIDNNRMDGQVFRSELKIGAHAMPPSLFTTAQSKFEGISRPLGENVEKTREEKKKSKERRDDKPREKNKDKEREKQSHGKQKDKEKEKKKEEKAKDKSEQKKIQEDKSRDTNMSNSVLSNNKLPLVSKENIAGTITEGIVRKRDVETNGFLHESEIRPAKLPRPSSSQQPIQNGKIPDPYPKADLFSSSKQEVAADIKLQKKEHKANGRVEDQTLSNTKAKASLPVIPGADQIAESSKAKASSSMIPAAESSKRPPHPDSKYLSQILLVPKTEDWSGFDDQEWLWASPVKKAKTCPDEVNKEYCVWSEALQIDSADVCALPYVIPY